MLNDAYNANPTSVAAALHSLAAPAGPPTHRGARRDGGARRRRGGRARGHRRPGRELGIRVLSVAAPAYGGEDVADVDAALDALGPLGDGDAVLVKGSRVAGLERLAAALLA